MEQEPQLNEKESLQLIQSMIAGAQNRLNRDWFYFILWGWMVLLASLGCYFTGKYIDLKYEGLPWAVLMPLGGVISMIYGMRQSRKETVKTYAGRMLEFISIGFFSCLLIVLILVPQTQSGWQLAYPLVMMIYGGWLFVSGAAIRFTPLMVGGAVNWALAVAAFFVHSREQVLVLSLAVFLGYLIPGYMLRSAYHKQDSEVKAG